MTDISKCSPTKLLAKCEMCWRMKAPDGGWQSYSNFYDGCKNGKWEYYWPVPKKDRLDKWEKKQ